MNKKRLKKKVIIDKIIPFEINWNKIININLLITRNVSVEELYAALNIPLFEPNS